MKIERCNDLRNISNRMPDIDNSFSCRSFLFFIYFFLVWTTFSMTLSDLNLSSLFHLSVFVFINMSECLRATSIVHFIIPRMKAV